MLGTALPKAAAPYEVPAPLYRSFCPTVIPGARARRGCGEAGLSPAAAATMTLLSAAGVAHARVGIRGAERNHCAGHCAGVRGMSPTKGGVRKHHPVGVEERFDRRSEERIRAREKIEKSPRLVS